VLVKSFVIVKIFDVMTRKKLLDHSLSSFVYGVFIQR